MTRKEYLERWRSLSLALLNQGNPALAVSTMANELPKWKGPGEPFVVDHAQAMADAIFGRTHLVREWIANYGRDDLETIEATELDRRRLSLLDRVTSQPSMVLDWSDDELEKALGLLGFDREALTRRLVYGRGGEQ